MKTIIVTGATKGLGFAITKKLIKDGYYVIGIGRKPSSEFELLLEEHSPSCLKFIPFDLGNTGEIRILVREIISSHKTIYGLVNNAAIGTDGVLATMHEADISKSLAVNLQSPIILSKYVVRPMLLAGCGRIINISSIIANTGFNGLSVYAATKAGLVGFTRSLARELGKANITVNAIAPGFMETDMTMSLQGDKFESIKRRTAMKNLAKPEQVAEAVAFLLKDSSSAITGTVLTVDAGSTA